MTIAEASAAKLYMAANRASADAIRWARDPAGIRLAAIRSADAEALRSLARAKLGSGALAALAPLR